MRGALLVSIVACALASAALAGEAPTLEEILARQKREAQLLLVDSHKLRPGPEQPARLAALLEKQADELSTFATTAPVESGRVARERAVEQRLEALRLRLSSEKPATPEETARVSSLRSALEKCGSETEARSFAIVLERARRDGQRATVSALDERVHSKTPGILAKIQERKGRVLVAAVTDERSPAASTPLARVDERERRALVEELGPRGLDLLDCSGEGARGLGVLTGRVELVLDRKGRVRGVDLVGDERRSLVRSLLEESP
ncbi:hypothetical protein HY251_09050 [bacterium]|nr:hypothetical protein [bacterium]